MKAKTAKRILFILAWLDDEWGRWTSRLARAYHHDTPDHDAYLPVVLIITGVIALIAGGAGCLIVDACKLWEAVFPFSLTATQFLWAMMIAIFLMPYWAPLPYITVTAFFGSIGRFVGRLKTATEQKLQELVQIESTVVEAGAEAGQLSFPEKRRAHGSSTT